MADDHAVAVGLAGAGHLEGLGLGDVRDRQGAQVEEDVDVLLGLELAQELLVDGGQLGAGFVEEDAEAYVSVCQRVQVLGIVGLACL